MAFNSINTPLFPLEEGFDPNNFLEGQGKAFSKKK